MTFGALGGFLRTPLVTGLTVAVARSLQYVIYVMFSHDGANADTGELFSVTHQVAPETVCYQSLMALSVSQFL